MSHKIHATARGGFIVGNELGETVAGPFSRVDVAESARVMLDKFADVIARIEETNAALRQVDEVLRRKQ